VNRSDGGRTKRAPPRTNAHKHAQTRTNTNKRARARRIYKASPERLFNVVFSSETLNASDKNFKLVEEKATIGSSYDVVYRQINAVGPVSARELLLVRHWRRYKGGYAGAHTSVEWKEVPVGRGHVRAYAPAGCGIVIVPADDERKTSRMITIESTDFKGWLPRAVLDMTLGPQLLKYYEETVPSMLARYTPDKLPDEEVAKYVARLFGSSKDKG